MTYSLVHREKQSIVSSVCPVVENIYVAIVLALREINLLQHLSLVRVSRCAARSELCANGRAVYRRVQLPPEPQVSSAVA